MINRVAWRSSTAAVVLAGLLAGCVAGCAGPSDAPPSAKGTPITPMTLSIDNSTTIPVTIVVNGKTVETVPPGGHEDPITAPLPGLPWSVETRSPSGRVLSAMIVRAGDVWQTTPDPSGNSAAQGDAVRVDLSCGRLDVWSGPPLLGPAFIPGPPGDCA
jgi:hypothetical protein